MTTLTPNSPIRFRKYWLCYVIVFAIGVLIGVLAS